MGLANNRDTVVAVEMDFDQGVFRHAFAENDQGSIGVHQAGEEGKRFIGIGHGGDFPLPGNAGAAVQLAEADLLAVLVQRSEAVRANLIWESGWIGGGDNFARDDGVDTELFEAGAKVAFEQIKSDEDHSGNCDQQASHEHAGEDATRLFQPARPGVPPEVGSD